MGTSLNLHEWGLGMGRAVFLSIIGIFFSLQMAVAEVERCDGELIGGFCLGAHFEPDERVVATRAMTNFTTKNVTREYELAFKNSFFERLFLRVDEQSRIVGLIFRHEYVTNRNNIKQVKEALRGDFSSFKEELEGRWGAAKEINAPLLLGRTASADLTFLKELSQERLIITPQKEGVGVIALLAESDPDLKFYVRGWDKSLYLYLAYLDEAQLVDEILERGDPFPDKTQGF